MKFEDGEVWKKVFGPVCIYLNSTPKGAKAQDLWGNAKEQVRPWPNKLCDIFSFLIFEYAS